MQVVPIREGKTPKEMLSSASPKGQITIPVAIRRLLGVKPKDTVAFAIKDGQVTISPARFSLESAFGSLEPPHGGEDFEQLITDAKEDKATRAVEHVQQGGAVLTSALSILFPVFLHNLTYNSQSALALTSWTLSGKLGRFLDSWPPTHMKVSP